MVCVTCAVILEMTEITVEVKCNLVLMMREDFELNVYLDIYIYIYIYTHMRSDKVCDLIAVKVLHTSLLNTTMVAFKVLPLGSYAPMPAPSPPFKTILELVLWNGL